MDKLNLIKKLIGEIECPRQLSEIIFTAAVDIDTYYEDVEPTKEFGENHYLTLKDSLERHKKKVHETIEYFSNQF